MAAGRVKRWVRLTCPACGQSKTVEEGVVPPGEPPKCNCGGYMTVERRVEK